MSDGNEVNKHWIDLMADADLNELLLLQDKDFNSESKEYAMELYYARIDEETVISILHESKNKEYRERHWYLYE